ncbi:MAG: PilN domain-containing protein, partial [bacterium]|nr:PilN domain-containing protein [bacterium]
EAAAAPALRLRAQIARISREIAEGQRLRASGPRAEAALAELAGRLPRSSWLTALEIAGDGTLRISGRAPAFESVGSLLAQLEAMGSVGTPALLDAQRPGRTGSLRFQIETRRP